MKEEGIEVKLFKVPREENHEVDLMAKLVTSKMAEMPRSVLMKIAEVLCIEKMLICTVEEGRIGILQS